MPKDRELNPVAAHRKKEKAKELKRNRELRKQHRDAALHAMTVDDIEQQLSKIRRLERSGQADVHVVQKRQRLEAEVVEARKRQQLQADEEMKRATEPQPTIVIKGSAHSVPNRADLHADMCSCYCNPFSLLCPYCMLCCCVSIRLDKIVGKGESKQSEEPGKEEKANSSEKDSSAVSSQSAPGPIDPAVELGIVVPPGQRLWLDEPPGLRKPPYLPPPPTTVSSSSSLPLIAPSSLSAPRPSPHSQSSWPPPTAEQPIIRIPLPSTPQPPAWQPSTHQLLPRPPPPPARPSPAAPSHSHAGFRGARPPPRSSSSDAEPPEIDPLDPNPDTALDSWNRGRGRGRGTSSPTTTAAPPPPVRSMPAAPAFRIIPRPAFVPTNLLVKNRPVSTDAAATVGRSNVSRPANTGAASVVVNAAPALSSAKAPLPSASSGAGKQRTQAELEYEALMRSLEAEGAL